MESSLKSHRMGPRVLEVVDAKDEVEAAQANAEAVDGKILLADA
jgi:hypothetical protein